LENHLVAEMVVELPEFASIVPNETYIRPISLESPRWRSCLTSLVTVTKFQTISKYEVAEFLVEKAKETFYGGSSKMHKELLAKPIRLVEDLAQENQNVLDYIIKNCSGFSKDFRVLHLEHRIGPSGLIEDFPFSRVNLASWYPAFFLFSRNHNLNWELDLDYEDGTFPKEIDFDEINPLMVDEAKDVVEAICEAFKDRKKFNCLRTDESYRRNELRRVAYISLRALPSTTAEYAKIVWA
jgi:hypothetical protein